MRTISHPGLEPASSVVAIRALLEAALGDVRTPTATTVARALHDLYLAEVHEQGPTAAERAWRALDGAALEKVWREFERCLYSPNCASYDLPAGTVVMGGMLGCALVGSQTLGVDVDRPGLHDMYDLPDRPGDSNLARLLGHIDKLSRRLPCRAIGVPRLVQRFNGRHPDYQLQFPPLACAGGAVLQRCMNFSSWADFFCAFTDPMLLDLATEIVGDMRELWAGVGTFEPRVRAARVAGEDAARRVSDVRIHAVTVELKPLFSDNQIAVEFDAWDQTFRRGVVVQGFGAIKARGKQLDPGSLDLADEVAALHALGADGRIGGVARAVVAAAPQGSAAVLAELAEGFESFVDLPTSTWPLRLRLHWRRGEIVAETRGGYTTAISEEGLTLRGRSLPESVVINLPGQPLHRIFDSPFACETPIAHIENGRGDLVIALVHDPLLVDLASGRMWPEPQGDATRSWST